MPSCNLEDWTVEELSNAIINEHKDKKIIQVPMFQRGKSRTKRQRRIKIKSQQPKLKRLLAFDFILTLTPKKWK